MAESADFAVQLIDRVSGPAQRMARSVSNAEDKLRRLQRMSNARIAASNERMRQRSYDHIVKSTRRLALESERAGPALNFMAKASGRLLGGLASIAVTGVKVAAAFGAIGSALFVKKLVEVANFSQKSATAFTLLTGSAEKGELAMSRARATARELGLSVIDTTKTFQKLIAQQFSLGEAEQLTRMIADLQAIGIEGEATQRVLMAITQIRSKGRLQAEELLQLAEAGVSLQLVYKELEKITGKTTDEIRKLQEAGKISADVALQAIQGAALKKTGGDAAGDAAKAFSQSTLQGAWNRVKSSGEEAFIRIGDAGGGALDRVTRILGGLAKRFDMIDGSKFGGFADMLAESFAVAVKWGERFITGFGEGFAPHLEDITNMLGMLQDDRTRGVMHSLGQAIGTVVGYIGKFTTAVVLGWTHVGYFIDKIVELQQDLQILSETWGTRLLRAVGIGSEPQLGTAAAGAANSTVARATTQVTNQDNTRNNSFSIGTVQVPEGTTDPEGFGRSVLDSLAGGLQLASP